MLFRLGRSALYGVVAFFALIGFVSVPLGEKTGWGHLQAIIATPAASQAVDEFRNSAGEWHHRAVDWLTARFRSPSNPIAEPATSSSVGASDFSVPPMPKKKMHLGSIPIAPPPHLSN